MKKSDKDCKWCKSSIKAGASYCKECNQWQSSFKQWLSPSTTISMIGALAAWLAVVYQALPKDPDPVLLSAQAVEALEQKAEVGCNEDQTNRCVYEFWALYSAAENSRDKVPNIEARDILRERIDSVMDKNSHNYSEAYEFELIE